SKNIYILNILNYFSYDLLIVLPFPLTGVCTDLPSVQQEIVDVHNAYRRAVEPTASNMLKMSWSDAVAQSAQGWIDQCNVTHGPPSSLKNLRGSNGWVSPYLTQSWVETTQHFLECENCSACVCSIIKWHIVRCSACVQVVCYSSYEVGCAVAHKCISVFTNPCPYINTFSNCDELKEMATCDHSLVSQWCPASCLCEDKIVPIARK
uniref:ShKT domain-containing protein n=1 Tax=Sinocyclocheilus grahami TaxID=75366 RepID=A0A672SFM6_SINGR